MKFSKPRGARAEPEVARQRAAAMASTGPQRQTPAVTGDYSLADRLHGSPRMVAQQTTTATLYGPAVVHAAVAQREGLTRKQIQAIDNQAWEIALAATAPIRPEGQQTKKINRGVDDDQNASTRLLGKRLDRLELTYYQDNDGFSQTNGSTRLGQMTALFNHELAYHGSCEVVRSMREDTDDPDDEHLSMFDPRRRNTLLETSNAALDALDDHMAQLEYIDWWEDDIKTHVKWADKDDVTPRQRREALAWAAKAASAMRLRAEALHEAGASA